jgi:hypothetical protein
MVMAKRSASFLFLSASISERITFFAPSGTLAAGSAATGSGFGSLAVLARDHVMGVFDTYLGPETDFDLPENDSLLEPSLLFSTVFILVNNLFTPFSFFSAGPSFAGVLMAVRRY